MSGKNDAPSLLYADERGSILDTPSWRPPAPSPGVGGASRRKIGSPCPRATSFPAARPAAHRYDPRARRFRVVDRDPLNGGPVSAVAALRGPGYTQLAAGRLGARGEAARLPLFAYTAAGWGPGGFSASALRIDPDPRQDSRHFDAAEIARQTRARLKNEPDNRLLRQPGTVRIEYGCPAAKTFSWGAGRLRCPPPLPATRAAWAASACRSRAACAPPRSGSTSSPPSKRSAV